MAVIAMGTDRAEHVRRLRAFVEDALQGLVADPYPQELYEPVRYVLAGEGKRLRPLLVLLSAEVFGVEPERTLPAALAVEVFHNFTLVHDDIMDHSDERRRRPTVHVQWDESTAILSGDYLMALSYDLLARVETDRLADVMHTYFGMVARLCEGQALDKAFEVRRTVALDEYLHMIDCKTGALLQASLELGGIIGHATDEQRTVLRALGGHIGRAFQIQDDLLDLVAENEKWGKPIGSDLLEGKKTFLTLSALQRAGGDDLRWFEDLLEAGRRDGSVVLEARTRMERLGVLDEAAQAVRHHMSAAEGCAEALPASEARETIRWLMKRMQERLH